MYKDLYSKASGMADLIQEKIAKPSTATTQAFVERSTTGLTRRARADQEQIVQDMEQSLPDMITGYISNIRRTTPDEIVLASVEEEPAPARGSGTWDYNQIGSFADRMIQSESSGRSNVQRQTQSDGRRQNMTGLFQFSDARLEDYMNDTGASFSAEDFRQDPDLQKDVFAWHIADIDRVIRDNELLSRGYSLDGLRAVAHLGGINGMLRYARTGGTYNPADEDGTSLNDYYNKFSGQE